MKMQRRLNKGVKFLLKLPNEEKKTFIVEEHSI